ncbi:MAG: glycoside hydrolase protein [Microvirga sp.]|nr:glycoside hydrolase protein [Microvirga sp.]
MAHASDTERIPGLSRRQALAGCSASALAGVTGGSDPATSAIVTPLGCDAQLTRISVQIDRVFGPLPKFWRSTGFTPAELLLLPEMRQTLSFLGAIPNRGLEFLRVHYLLDLVVGTRDGGRIAYDWSLFDEALDTMIERGLRPFLEIMGNPSGLFDNFEDMDQVRAWRDLVAELASRCIARYGGEEVREWWFETWNEPDLPFWRWGERGLLNYVDACRAGLDAVDSALRFGGPGTALTLSPTFRAFLGHCDEGANVLTGKTGVRLDFISVHEKGSREHEADLTPRTLGIIERERKAIEYIRARHPRLAGLPLINNECDPEVGWRVPHTYRARAYYAALMVKMIDQHQRLLIDGAGVDCAILSNDNGFIGRFVHRTHLAYFGGRPITKAQAEHRTDLALVRSARTTNMPFELVKKPALAVTEILALLGTERCAIDAELDPDNDGVGVLATRSGEHRIAILLYNSLDRIWVSGQRRTLIHLSGLRPGEYTVATLRLDDANGCAFHLWDAWQAPDPPNTEQLSMMRQAGEASLGLAAHQVGPNGLALELTLLLPSVTLILVERVSAEAPGTPTRLRADGQSGLTERESMLLTWTPGAHWGVQVFDVLFARGAGGSFDRVNPTPLLSAAFLHAREPGHGRYMIEARSLSGSAHVRSDPIEA